MSVSSGSVLRKSDCRAIQEVGGADIQSKMSEIVAKYSCSCSLLYDKEIENDDYRLIFMMMWLFKLRFYSLIWEISLVESCT